MNLSIEKLRGIIPIVISRFRLILIEASAGDGKQPVACLQRVSDRKEHFRRDRANRDGSYELAESYFGRMPCDDLPLSVIIKIHIRIKFLGTFLTNAMAEFRFRMVMEIGLNLIPVSLIISYFFTVRANREKSFQSFYFLA